MSLKTSKINIVNNPNKSFTQSSFIDAKNNQNDRAGSLFLLIEINRADRLGEKIAFIISQLLEKNYYLNEKIFLADQINSLKIESVFESALVKTNRELLEFIDQEKINFNFIDLSIIVGLIYDGQIHFSSMGQNKSFLIRKNEKGWQVSDINPDDENPQLNGLSSGKIFSSIISGELPNESYTIFTNASLAQYLLNDEVINVLEKLKLDGATEQIKNLINNINNYSNFCGLIIKNFNNYREQQEFKYVEPNLELAEKKTEKLLTDLGDINKKAINKSFQNFLNKINIFKYLEKLIKKLKKIRIKKEENKNEEIPIVTTDIKKKKRWLLIALGALLIILAVSLYSQRDKKTNIFVEENVSSHEEKINQKLSQIESSLLYNNEEKAKEIIKELQDLMVNLTDKERNKIKNYSDLENELKTQIEKIQKIIKIQNPKEVANFSLINEQAQVSAIAPIISNNKIYGIDGQNKAIYSLNLSDNLLAKIADNENLSETNSISHYNQDSVQFLTENQIVSINSKEEISLGKISPENRDAIKSFAIYNNRPYLLDSQKNQIFKYSRKNNDFDSPSAWIKDNSNIKALSLIIDYNIYILDQSGVVYKYLEGNRQEYKTEVIEPVMEKPEILRMSDKYIFIMDKVNKRIAVFFKEDGYFINQYYLENLNNIKDFVINEKESKLYILNENSIYEINLTF